MTKFSQDALTSAQRSREAALYAAYRIAIGDETFDACDVIDFAEYIRTGARGVPIGYIRGATPSAILFDEIKNHGGGS